MNDEDELIACLLAVHRRLVENEPKFEDEDVVSPQLVPTHFSPLRSKEEDDGVVFPNADGGGFAGNGAGAEMSPATKRPADLVPGPLSLTAQMNLFDPRQIIKSRKAAAELIKLVRRLHLTRPEPNHQPQPAAISATAGPSRQLNCFTPPPANHGASSAPSSPAMARVGMVDDDSVRASVLNHPRYVYLLDQIVQSLAVYCNESIHLQQAVAERGNVQMLCSIGLAGRMLENRGLMPQGRSLDEVARPRRASTASRQHHRYIRSGASYRCVPATRRLLITLRRSIVAALRPQVEANRRNLCKSHVPSDTNEGRSHGLRCQLDEYGSTRAAENASKVVRQDGRRRGTKAVEGQDCPSRRHSQCFGSKRHSNPRASPRLGHSPSHHRA